MTPNSAQALPQVLNGRRFVVPDYQRPYSWQTQQLEDLWHDLDLMTDKSKHYTGTLVLKDLDREVMDDAGDVYVECEVVDGQQRLTTCLILIAELRQALLKLPHDLAAPRAENLEKSYGRLVVGGLPQARLQLGEDLNKHWMEVILGNGQQSKQILTEGEIRLDGAKDFFRIKLDELTADLDPNDALRVLQRLQTRLTHGLHFLIYEIEPSSHAGEIFETLNGRGRPLTSMEKIKNYLLFLADYAPENSRGTLAREINQAWSNIYALLASQDTDESLVLRAHWLATHQPRAQNWKGSVSIKQRFARERYVPGSARLSSRGGEDKNPEGPIRLVQDVRSYVRSLEQCAMFAAEFHSLEAKYQSFGNSISLREARSSAARLKRTDTIAPFMPLIFAARLLHPGDGKFYTRLLDACERYAARVYLIGQRRTNTGSSRLNTLAHELYCGRKSTGETLQQITHFTLDYANDEIIRAGLSSTQNWYLRRSHKYFLYEYELSLASRVDDVPPFSTYADSSNRGRTTEHILPQNPNWDSGQWSAFSQEEHTTLVNSIGNLVLTDDNSHYSNHSFDRKKGSAQAKGPCYATSRLAQEREIAEVDDWTPEQVRERGRRLQSWALKRWYVERPSTTQVIVAGSEDDDEDTETEAVSNL
ncbi:MULTISPECIES: DUF262 domain-containing protein [unclassified Dietzia]|uniref:DUF262 domain-containing protein n=1 Tax=unclassified Dietzia TaxID=2617939 RepID=UPI0015FBF7DD|nr:MULTISPECIES: DUF262 domain-containing protein [unclassified Dietzia]MBB1026071.1 DUF262 domain-containing protein [Dietzia sp. DQ12-76]MBB1029057.1 DUF262 domain-containing protein [Dietzia sp. DQ11-38-2]